jgi:hypothetical protein
MTALHESHSQIERKTQCTGTTTSLVSSPECFLPMSCHISCAAYLVTVSRHHSLTGKGLSSPTVNVVWALFNLAVGYILFHVGKVSTGDYSVLVIFFAGIAVLSMLASVRFAEKHAE